VRAKAVIMAIYRRKRNAAPLRESEDNISAPWQDKLWAEIQPICFISYLGKKQNTKLNFLKQMVIVLA
jgi:hypothetical protein